MELSCYSCSTFVGIGPSSVDINMGSFCFDIYGVRMQVWKNDFEINAKPFKFIVLLSANTCLSGYVGYDKTPQHLNVAIWLLNLGH